MLEFPSPIVLPASDPLLGAEPIAMSHGQAFTFAWTRGVGRIELDLEEASDTPESVTLKCRFPSEAGHGTVEAAALAKLPLAAAGARHSGTLQLRSMAEVVVRAGDFVVRVTAEAPLRSLGYKVVP
jgi:hypothetical protein